MELSLKQVEAYDAVQRWYHDPSAPQIFRLFGFAGTGKSTIANTLVSDISGLVLFGTFTGKAASVLRKKGVKSAQTIHSMIYRVRKPSLVEIEKKLEEINNAPAPMIPKLKEELIILNRPIFDLIPAEPSCDEEVMPIHDASLIVVDEVSMVDEEMGRDLESFGKKILVLGDPGQLPPIKGQGYFTDGTPNILLEEIHRQATDSPIIQLATSVRCGQRLRFGSYGSSVVKSSTTLRPDDLLQHSQVLVGRNATRRGRNILMRNQLGYRDPLPIEGDRLICLKNNRKLGLFNGAMFKVRSRSKGRWVEMSLEDSDQPDRDPILVSAHEEVFHGKELAEMPWHQRKLADEFDYAYAITVHKAQGSQWESVLIQNESYCFKEHAARWLYTAITRAEERVTLGL